MSAKPPFPVGPFSILQIGEVDRVVDGRGRDVMRMEGGAQRLVDCANALRHVWFPKAHVEALEARCERLEKLRADAWDRVKQLEGEFS